MKLFSESWHHRLATFIGPLTTCVDESEDEFCQDYCASTKGAFSVAGLIFAGGVAATLLGDFFAWIAAMIVNGTWIYPDDLAMVVALLASIVAIAGLSFLLHVGVVKPTYEKVVKGVKYMSETPAEDTASFSFLRTWLYTFKHKVCVPVKVKGISSK